MGKAFRKPEYNILEAIHLGPWCEVVRAVEQETQAPVILKSLRAEQASSVNLRKLQREFMVSQWFEEPQLIKYRWVEACLGRPTLVSDDFGGHSLERLLSQNRFSESDQFWIVAEVAKALEAVHQRHAVYLNLDLSHVVFNRASGLVRLVDLGQVREVEQLELATLETDANQPHADFLAPEAAGLNRRPLDVRSDLYSLGVLIYWLFQGESPFAAMEPIERSHAKTTELPHKNTIRLGSDLGRIAMKLMEAKPEKRYQSVRSLLADLQKVQSSPLGLKLGEVDGWVRLNVSRRFYGHPREIRKIKQLVEQSLEGRVETLVVRGPIGTGKTRLFSQVHELFLASGGIGIKVSFSDPNDLSLSSSWKSFLAPLTQLAAESSGSEPRWEANFKAFMGEELGVMETFFLELPQKNQHQEARTEGSLVSGLSRLISYYNHSHGPLLLCFDSIDQASLADLELLNDLLKQLSGHLLLMLNSRQGIEACLPQVQKMKPIRVELKNLPVQHFQAFLKDSLGLNGAQSVSWSRAMLPLCEGNLLVAKGLLRQWIGSQELSYQATTGWKLSLEPDPTERPCGASLFERQLQTLAPDSLKLLQQASLSPGTCLLSDLSRSSAVPLSGLFDLLEEPRAAQLINLQEDRLHWNHPELKNLVIQSSSKLWVQQERLNSSRVFFARRADYFDLSTCLFLRRQVDKQLDSEAEKETTLSLVLQAGKMAAQAGLFAAAHRWFDFGVKLSSAFKSEVFQKATQQLHNERVTLWLAQNQTYEAQQYLSRLIDTPNSVEQLGFLLLQVQIKVQQGDLVGIAADLKVAIQPTEWGTKNDLIRASGAYQTLLIQLIQTCILPLIESPEALCFESASLLEKLCQARGLTEQAAFAKMLGAAALVANGRPLEAQKKSDRLLLDLDFSKPIGLQTALVYHSLIRPYFATYLDCAESLKPLVVTMASHQIDWAVQATVWLFDLLWHEAEGPEDFKAFLGQLKRQAPQVYRQLPAGMEACFMSTQPQSGAFRVPLFEALLAYLRSDSPRANDKLTEAKKVKPFVASLGYEALLLFLSGALGLKSGESEDLLSLQSLHLLADMAEHQEANLAPVSEALYSLRKVKHVETSQGILVLEAALEKMGAQSPVFYQLALSECLAQLCLFHQQPQKAKYTLMAMIQLAQSWGLAKVVELYQQRYSSVFEQAPFTFVQPALSQPQPDLLLDLQEISKETHSQSLASKLLSVVLKQTGAQKGLIVFFRSDQPDFEQGLLRQGEDEIPFSQPRPNQEYPISVTEQVRHTRQDMVLSQAHLRGPFADDPYIQQHQVRSLLCVNLGFPGETFGVLYLEHSRVEGAFTDTRIEPLKLLISQAKIAWENVQLYEQQRSLVKQLRQLDQMKGDFIAHTSQELLTPLAGIIGLTQMAMDKTHPKGSKKQLELVVQSAKRLTHLVNDLLDISLIRENRLVIKPSLVDLKPLVENLFELCRPLCGARPVELVSWLPEDLPFVLADPERLQQILYNLIDYGIKNCPVGQVSLKATQQGEKVKLVVSDTGVGLEAEQLARLFEPFGSPTAKESLTPGSGIGLALSQQLVRLHQGELSASSVLGQGTSFCFDLPIPKGSPSPIATQEKPYFVSPRVTCQELGLPSQPRKAQGWVLIVEDDPILLYTTAHYLAKSGFGYLMAENREEALWQLEKNPEVDVVLLDVAFADDSGLELCRELRLEHGRAELPVILLSANNRPDDLINGFQMGANDYLMKSAIAEELLARIQAQVQAKQSHLHARHNQRLQQEISRRQNAEESLKTHRQVLLRFFDQLENAVFALDKDRIITLSNSWADRLLGFGSKRFVGRKLAQVLPLLDNQVAQAIAAGKEHLTFTLPLIEKKVASWELSLLSLGNSKGWLAHLYQGDSKAHVSSPALKALGEELIKREGQLGMRAELSPLRFDQVDPGKSEFSVSKKLEMVELMGLSLRYWNQTMRKNKIDLATTSGIWHVTCDRNGTYRTRTLDRYLKLRNVPKKPRWREVLQTVYFVIQYCPDQAGELKRELEERVARIEDWLSLQ